MQHIGSVNLQDSDLIKEKKIKGYLLFHYLESMQDRPPIELLVTGSGSALSSTKDFPRDQCSQDHQSQETRRK